MRHVHQGIEFSNVIEDADAVGRGGRDFEGRSMCVSGQAKDRKRAVLPFQGKVLARVSVGRAENLEVFAQELLWRPAEIIHYPVPSA